MTDNEDSFNDIFGDDDSSSELRRLKAKESIDQMLERTMIQSLRATGRAIERVNSEHKESISEKVKIRTGGIVVRSNGTETRHSMLALLDPDIEDYGEIEISEIKLSKIKKQLRTASIGPISAVAMICTGNQCQVKEMCPFWKNDVAPIGEECLLEKNLIREWVERYIDEFNVDITRTTELQLVSELAEIAVYERRINSYISINSPMLLQEVVAGVDQAGNAYYNLDIAKAFEIKDRLKKQRMKILDAMLATRDRKAKLVVAAASATSNLSELSSLKKRINDLARNRREGTTINAEEQL
jgi:hypothetical protein